MKNAMGLAPFTWRGAEIQTVVIPYRFYRLQRLQDAYDRQSPAHQSAIRTLFENTGLESLLSARTTRRVERCDNQEVWGEAR